MKLTRNYKQIHDNIHGPIPLTNYACRMIDTYEFERLRYLKQLGTCYYVYPTATHTRFEHSLGTYFLVDWILKSIKINSNKTHVNDCLKKIPELQSYYHNNYGMDGYDRLDDHVCELIKIAGLCHDLGHGPFSHLFDDIFIPIMANLKGDDEQPLHLHENRSCEIMELIIKKDEHLSKIISDNDIQFIKNLINPTDKCHGFIYQIISNNFNSIDVDKFDYLIRDSKNLDLKFSFDYVRLLNDAKVINNIICYPIQMFNEVSAIFDTRYRLHKQVYNHKVVISSQYMINDMMLMMEPIANMYEMANKITEFHTLTDNFVIETVKFLHLQKNNKMIENMEHKQIIDRAYQIWININERKLYKFIGSIVSKFDKNISLDRIIELDTSIDSNDIILHKSKIGFVSGKKSNPFDKLYFYNNKNPDICKKIMKEEISCLIPDTYQEYIYMFFVKDLDNTNLINKLTSIFHLFNKE
jgi:HD superfamily phosphohydrolase